MSDAVLNIGIGAYCLYQAGACAYRWQRENRVGYGVASLALWTVGMLNWLRGWEAL